MLSQILLAVDGSGGARKAADFARKLVDGTAAHLTVLLVLEPPVTAVLPVVEGLAFSPQHPTEEELRAATTLMGAIREAVGHEHVTERVEVGGAAEVICKVADEVGAELIIVGARGRSAVERWILGSVSERVAHHAGRAVAIVP